MNSQNIDSGDMELMSLELAINEQKHLLEEDSLKLKRTLDLDKRRRSDGNHYQPFRNDVVVPENKSSNYLNVDKNHKLKDKYVPKNKSNVFMVRNSREDEINRLIEKISKPKEQNTFTINKELRRSYPQTRSNAIPLSSPVNIREQAKDQLSEKLASSECPLTKLSCRQIGKNLCSSISFNSCTENILKNEFAKRQIINQESYDESKENISSENREEYLRAKYNHPRIVISHYKDTDKDIENSKDNKMVRIGEFSPLNPNLPGGATVLGLGEWDQRRQFLLEKYRQVSRSPSPSPYEDDSSRRSIATQTDTSDDWSSNITMTRSPQRVSQIPESNPDARHEHGHEDNEVGMKCCSPRLELSPLPKCFENMTEKEIKEFLYRQELEKQIAEKNRLKEEMKRKEAKEEAKIEAKIQRDLERMRRQYEEERLQRLEIAIRKREQEDLLRERLAFEQQKAMLGNKTIKNHPVRDIALQSYALKQYEKSTQSDFERSIKAKPTRKHYSRSLPEQSAATALSSVHKELRKPLLQPSSNLLSAEELENFLPVDKSPRNKSPSSPKHVLSPNTSTSPPITLCGNKQVDILAQKAVFETNLKTSPRRNNVSPYPSDIARDRLKEVDNILKQPLLPEYHRVLPPVSQPLIHATIPPLSASLQTHKASTRANADILEDKWKVPYVEIESNVTPDTRHNTRILTQLGTFRRQLQQESLRMRQRVREDSP